MDSTPRSWRCAKPHSTNHSTDRYTASQLVWKARAVSRQLSRRPQRAKNPIMAQVNRSLAVAPRNVLDYDPMLGTLHSPWRVAKVGGDSPQRHEEPASLGQAVIARRRFLTTRTAPAYASMRLYSDHDRRCFPLQTMHAHLLVYESDESLHLIQDGLNL